MFAVQRVRRVCVIDDEADVRASLCDLLALESFECRAYATATEFYSELDDSVTDCVVADLRMPGEDGLALQHQLAQRGCLASLVVVTGYATIASTVVLMRNGALTVLEKPIAPEELINAVVEGVQTAHLRREHAAHLQSLYDLTPEERQLLDLIVLGIGSKQIAQQLGCSLRTVYRRREQLVEKLGTDSPYHLFAIVQEMHRKYPAGRLES